MVKAVVCGAAGKRPSPQSLVLGIRRPCIPPDGNTLLTLSPGGIGQPLSLLLKLNPLITELSLYDVVNAPGVSALSFTFVL